eukprot:853186-Prymnesium_polylepis.1
MATCRVGNRTSPPMYYVVSGVPEWKLLKRLFCAHSAKLLGRRRPGQAKNVTVASAYVIYRDTYRSNIGKRGWLAQSSVLRGQSRNKTRSSQPSSVSSSATY